MADKLRLGPEVRELKLGPSFGSSRAGAAFHTLKCKLHSGTLFFSVKKTVKILTYKIQSVCMRKELSINYKIGILCFMFTILIFIVFMF